MGEMAGRLERHLRRSINEFLEIEGHQAPIEVVTEFAPGDGGTHFQINTKTPALKISIEASVREGLREEAEWPSRNL